MSVGIRSKKVAQQLSSRKHVNRKIFRFSLLIGVVATILTLLFLVASVYPSLNRAGEINRRTMAEINCTETGCNTSALATDWVLSDADYIVDTKTRFLLSVPVSTAGEAARYKALDYSDIAFIGRFRQPTTYPALNGETWRLYSEAINTDSQRFEIIVGYAEKASWKMIDSPK